CVIRTSTSDGLFACSSGRDGAPPEAPSGALPLSTRLLRRPSGRCGLSLGWPLRNLVSRGRDHYHSGPTPNKPRIYQRRLPMSATFMTPEELLRHWQSHRGLTRRMIEAYPEDQLFSFTVGGMRPFGKLALEMISMAERSEEHTSELQSR